MKNCIETNKDINLAVLQAVKRSSTEVNKSPLFCDYGNDHYNILTVRQDKLMKKNDTLKSIHFYQQGLK